jgi:hypothetical protein
VDLDFGKKSFIIEMISVTEPIASFSLLSGTEDGRPAKASPADTPLYILQIINKLKIIII